MAVVALPTEVVEIEKFALEFPAGTVTLLGTEAFPLELLSETTTPPDGAIPLSPTVPWVEVPPVTLAGLSESDDRVTDGGGTAVTCRDALLEAPPYEPEIFVAVDEPTMLVVTVKLAVEEPAGTVTLPGTLAAPLEVDSVTGAPPDGAGALSWTVACDDEPPMTLLGLRLMLERAGAGGGGA